VYGFCSHRLCSLTLSHDQDDCDMTRKEGWEGTQWYISSFCACERYNIVRAYGPRRYALKSIICLACCLSCFHLILSVVLSPMCGLFGPSSNDASSLEKRGGCRQHYLTQPTSLYLCALKAFLAHLTVPRNEIPHHHLHQQSNASSLFADMALHAYFWQLSPSPLVSSPTPSFFFLCFSWSLLTQYIQYV